MTLSTIKIIKKYNLTADKKLGQNFLIDDNISSKIIKASEIHDISCENLDILEIGPGIGSLSKHLININAKRVLFVEKDEKLIPVLKDIIDNEISDDLDKKLRDNLLILNQDATLIKIKDLLIDNNKIHIISNLPYNVGCRILVNLLEEAINIGSMTLMLQKEVVDRIIAKQNSKSYGKLSILCQLTCDVKKKFDVPKTAFHPIPNVISSIVYLKPKQQPISKELFDIVKYVTHEFFIRRRKIISSALKIIFKDKYDIAIKDLSLDAKARAQTLSVETYFNIAKYILNSK